VAFYFEADVESNDV